MRRLTAAGLLAWLAALAGCGSSDPTYPPPSQETLNQVAGRFHDRDSNRPLPDQGSGEVPLKYLDLRGKEVDLASFRGRAHVVLVVVKGMPRFPGGAFCPGCLAQVNALTANHPEFQKREAEILMVFPGSKDKLPQFFKDARVDGQEGNPGVPFPLLVDEDLRAVRALGIVGDLAKPSTYILDKQGNAVFAFVGEGTTDRPSVSALLARLDKLNAKR
ncbi:MAG: peroxiredoxin family protein [Gemmataceae bacterium]|nr:peroxiredoxin family protein [Gemmataceae bacterium]